MKCAVRWHNQRDVVAAMARAHRHVPKRVYVALDADDEVVHTHSPEYLIPEILRYAQKEQEQQTHRQSFNETQQLGDSTVGTSTSDSSALAQFIQVAKRSLENSLASFRQTASVSLPVAPSTTYCIHRDPHDVAAASTDGCMSPSTVQEIGCLSPNELEAAVRAYSPTIDRAIIQRIAARIAMTDTLLLARRISLYLQEAAVATRSSASANEAHEHQISLAQTLTFLRRAVEVCRERYVTNSPDMSKNQHILSPLLWAMTPAAREGAGIAARLHCSVTGTTNHAHRRRRQLPRCFLRYTSDVQVNEVLPNGAVVTFTHATRPEEVGNCVAPAKGRKGGGNHDASAASAEVETARPRFAAAVSFRESLELCLISCPSMVHLHFVLYRRGVSLETAIGEIVEASEGQISAQDVCVNVRMPENDEHVVVQLCSVRLTLPESLQPHNSEDAVQYCLHAARTVVQLNLSDETPRVALQLLDCRTDACGTTRTTSQGFDESSTWLQYALLLRGFEERGGPANHLDQASLTCTMFVPNYFPPHHFGVTAIPFFRTYHVTEALAKRRYADAAVMLACLEVGATAETSSEVPSWLARALQLLCRGEDREGVWQAWWMNEIPAATRRRMACAKRDLVWNVVASCRLQDLAKATGGRRDVLLAVPPMPGDFVAPPEEVRKGAASRTTLKPLAQSVSVMAVYNQAQAARYNVYDIALPLVLNASSISVGYDDLADIEAQLGFTRVDYLDLPSLCSQQPQHSCPDPSAVVHTNQTVFRQLLVEASGYPRSTRPWCRSFPEPTVGTALSHSNMAWENKNVFSLATDWDLANETAATRDYALKSRGPRAQVWPLSKRGRALTDRLPAGLMTVASAEGSSLLGTASTVNHHGSRCLAIHCTLPANLSLANILAELAMVEDLRNS